MKNQRVLASGSPCQAANLTAFGIGTGITLGSHDYRHGAALVPAHGEMSKPALNDGQNRRDQISFQPWQDDLCLRVTKAAVELNDLWPVSVSIRPT